MASRSCWMSRWTPIGAGRVVRSVEYDQAGAVGDGVTHLLPVNRKLRIKQVDVPCYTAVEGDAGFVGIVGRVKHDHFITRVHHGGNGAIDCLGGAGCDHNFTIGID